MDANQDQDQDDIVRSPGRDDVKGGLRLADDLLRVGDRSRAAEAYAKVADLLAERGDAMRAVAVCYRALQVDALHFATAIGEITLRRLGTEARPLLERALEAAEAEEDWNGASEIMRRLVDRDPDSTALRLHRSELLERAGRSRDAIDLLWSMTQALERDGNNAELIQVGPRLLAMAPEHVAARRALARAYLRVGDLGDCLQVVRPLVRAGKDPVALEIFARLQIELGRNEGAFEVLRCLAAVRAAAGEHHLADEVLARASRWAFDDEAFRKRIAELRGHLASSVDLGPAVPPLDGLDAEVVELDIELAG
jgi:predicted Zn-dependent protease